MTARGAGAATPRKPRKPRKTAGTPKGGRREARPRIGLGLLLLLLLLSVPASMAAWSWWRLQRPYQGYEGEEKIVAVEPGMGANQILARLESEGVIADAGLARLYLVVWMRDAAILAGEYRFRGPLSTPRVLRQLVRGEVLTRAVTLVEGLTVEETARALANAGFGDAGDFLDVMRSPELVADLDPEATDLEGYLFPETYNFASGTGERQIVETLVKTFRERFERQVRPRLEAGGRAADVREVVTLASIVEKEARVDAERPLIAAVYRNRLDRGMGLYADPTIIYALKRMGRWDGNLRRQDLELDSPYNTYRSAGLPPGPIASPGLASLAAAAEPADAPYLYFVGRNDGTHVFAETYDEHRANVDRWQRQYWRERRAEERRQAAGQGADPP